LLEYYKILQYSNMGLHEAMIPASFIMVAIFAIALTSINIQTYLTTNKPKDSNFNFSAVILALSIVALGVAGYFTFKSFQAPSEEAEAAATALAKSLPNFNAAEATVPTSEQVQALAHPNNVRHAQGAMNAELDKLISALGETKQVKNAQLQARLQGLIAAAQAMAAATEGAA
jgi:hypothetical protein